jgi:hypothetical protein
MWHLRDGRRPHRCRGSVRHRGSVTTMCCEVLCRILDSATNGLNQTRHCNPSSSIGLSEFGRLLVRPILGQSGWAKHMVMRLLLAVLSTAALLSLSLYIGLAYWGHSRMLYSTALSVLPTRRARIVLILAAGGLLTCLFQGAHGMLFWLPSTLGAAWVRTASIRPSQRASLCCLHLAGCSSLLLSTKRRMKRSGYE